MTAVNLMGVMTEDSGKRGARQGGRDRQRERGRKRERDREGDRVYKPSATYPEGRREMRER